ncbi:MAG: hypothetical protein EXS39_03215 [Opitutaceae bacterium]|nr:hypothetical protein [Opitutaceae bacterium]
MSEKPAKPPRKRRVKAKAALLGLAVDNDDGHKRVTTGPQFLLVGGSQETHDRMTETVVKSFEELKRRDKQLETVDPGEFAEILDKSRPL